MSERYWFKRRRYGYGFQPVTREGWLVVGGLLAVVLLGALAVVLLDPDGPVGPTVYVASVAVALAGFLVVTLRHSPRPRWRWGRKPGDRPDEDV